MFDIGWSELLILAVVAILVVGPRDLPRMMRAVGKYAGKMRRTANEFKAQFDDAIRESELDDLRKELEEVREVNPIRDIQKSLTDLDPTKIDSDTGSKTAKPKATDDAAVASPDAEEGILPPTIEPPAKHGDAHEAAPADAAPEEVSARAATGKSGA